MRLSSWLLLSQVALSACHVDEVIEPAPKSSSSTSASSSSSGGSGGGGAVVRTVSVRSPWGGPAQNLLADGDFELSISFDGHAGPNSWYAFDTMTDGSRYLRGETGGLCRTGLRCAVLEANMVLFGRGTGGPDGGGVDASAWAKPPTGKSCDVVSVSLLDCAQTVFSAKLKPTGATPDESGWCSYAASIAKAPTKRCMYVESNLGPGEVALFDSAVVVASPKPRMDVASSPLSGDSAARANRLMRRVRDLTPLGGRAPLVPPAVP